MERKKPGPKSKGDRDLLKGWGPPEFIAAAKQAAEQSGRSQNDFVLDAVSAYIGRPWREQEQLPLEAAA